MLPFLVLFGFDKRSMVVLALFACILSVQCEDSLYKWEMGTPAFSGSGDGKYEDCLFEGTATSAGLDGGRVTGLCQKTTFSRKEYQSEGLTWDILIEACPQLEYAG